ncbi:MAG: DUF47 domain-containing protein [Phycisphaeraceae bacterium]|nr:DUF47 domain-containing protein [Phycisphaeraceae bacterium]
MFNLLPKDTIFFDLFEKIAAHGVSASNYLQRLVKEFPAIDGPLQVIRNEEHAADELSHQALDRLDRTFITPFDREDIHELVGGLDDIIDEIDALAKRIKLYHVKSIEVEFIRQIDILVQSTVNLHEAVLLLRKSRKFSDLKLKLIEIHRLESVGDDNNHAAVSRLYEGNTPPLEVMKWKEFYDRIEKAIDKCEDVGNTLERIVLKNG